MKETVARCALVVAICAFLSGMIYSAKIDSLDARIKALETQLATKQ